MRTVRDVMTADALHVSPMSTVQAAVLLLRKNGRLVLPVLDEGRLVGVIDAATLFMYQPDIVLADIMAVPASVGSDAPLSAAASVMRAHCLTELPVVDDGLIGILKSADLLSAWAMPVDPLTGLPWQDSFRLRSSMHLSAGEELTLLFFDMDSFGALNKRYGHIVGDHALQAVADALKQAIDPATDEACRYGGDEFVVATTRPRAEAQQWAAAVRDTIAATPVEGLEERLSVSIGVSGGLRHAERPGSHAPATLDDLINRASQASTLAKTAPEHMRSLEPERIAPVGPVPPAEIEPGFERPETEERPVEKPRRLAFSARPARIRIQGVRTDISAGRTRADVRLEHLGLIQTGTAEGAAADEAAILAEAAASAVGKFLPSRYTVHLTFVAEQVLGLDERVMTAVVRLEGPYGRQNLVGIADVASDPRRAAVKAILDALNRPLEALAQTADLAGSPVLS